MRTPDQEAESTSEMILLATSYRFECTLFRNLKLWWQPRSTERYNLVKQQLCRAMCEIDKLFNRAIASGTLRDLPVSLFVSISKLCLCEAIANSNSSKSCIPMVLALYTEMALDASETEANRSMALVYIHQDMLLLNELRDFPLIQRAVSIFEVVLEQKDLFKSVRERVLKSGGLLS